MTRKPDPTRAPEGRVVAEVAEFGTYRLLGALSAPLSSQVAGGLTAEYATSDGYVHNATVGEDENYYDRYSVRGSLAWAASDRLEGVLGADTSRWNGNEMANGVFLNCGCYTSLGESLNEDQKENTGAHLTINWDLSDNTQLTSITGGRRVESEISQDGDAENTNLASTSLPGVPGYMEIGRASCRERV